MQLCKVIVQTYWIIRKRKIKFRENPLKWLVQLVLGRPMGPEEVVRKFRVKKEEDEDAVT